MSDVDVCRCGHHQAFHDYFKSACQHWRCPCTEYESARCPKFDVKISKDTEAHQ